MDKIESLANDLAFLSTDSLMRLAQILVTHYPQRADVLETQINVAFFDKGQEGVNV